MIFYQMIKKSLAIYNNNNKIIIVKDTIEVLRRGTMNYPLNKQMTVYIGDILILYI